MRISLLLSTLALTLAAITSFATAETIIYVNEDVMTSAFFDGTDRVRGYDEDDRSVHRVSTDNAFGSGKETVYMTFDHDFSAIAFPVTKAVLRVSSEAGRFGADATPTNPFTMSAHGVDANPLTDIADNTSSGTIVWSDFFADNILASDDAARTTVTGFGILEFDVTTLVNSWVGGSTASKHGIFALTGKDHADPDASILHGITNNSESTGIAHTLVLNPEQVPEPGSIALLGLAGMGLTFAGRRKRNRS